MKEREEVLVFDEGSKELRCGTFDTGVRSAVLKLQISCHVVGEMGQQCHILSQAGLYSQDAYVM